MMTVGRCCISDVIEVLEKGSHNETYKIFSSTRTILSSCVLVIAFMKHPCTILSMFKMMESLLVMLTIAGKRLFTISELKQFRMVGKFGFLKNKLRRNLKKIPQLVTIILC